MTVVTHQFTLRMQGNTEVGNITAEIVSALENSQMHAGILTVFVRHTTAAVMLFEDEPGLREDTKNFWNGVIPADPQWRHNVLNAGEDNAHSHLRAQVQGQSLTVPFSERQMMLGRWQQIVVVDFDTGARSRDIVLQILGE